MSWKNSSSLENYKANVKEKEKSWKLIVDAKALVLEVEKASNNENLTHLRERKRARMKNMHHTRIVLS